VPDLRAWLDGDDRQVGHDVVVIGGGKPGLSLADLCLRRGHAVTVVEPTAVLGVELGLPGRFRLVHDLEAAGALLVASAEVVGIEPDGVRVRTPASSDGEGGRVLAADTVIVAGGAVPGAPLAEALYAGGIDVPVSVVGDAHAVEGIEGATNAAASIAAALDVR
jgi:NADPH-dependent 2,4-dienoyl-CoA reductase/sulfur reductase-like enzyme